MELWYRLGTLHGRPAFESPQNLSSAPDTVSREVRQSMRGAATSKSRIRAVKSSQLRILLARPGGHFLRGGVRRRNGERSDRRDVADAFQFANVTHQRFGLFCAQHSPCALEEFGGGILPAQMHL